MTASMIIWVALIVVFCIIEAVTVGLVSIWFAIGSAGGLISAIFTDNAWIQIGVFVVVSAVALAITRPLVKKLSRSEALPTNADRNIGRTATVIEPIAPERPGRVKLDGVDWGAVSDTPLEEGALCEVVAVNGTHMTVVAKKETAAV